VGLGISGEELEDGQTNADIARVPERTFPGVSMSKCERPSELLEYAESESLASSIT
jgi:hypothetical protein